MTFRLMAAAAVIGSASAAVSMFIVYSQRWHGKHTLDSDLDGVQKVHTTAVPRIGGVAIVSAIIFALLACNYLGIEERSRTHVLSALSLLIAGLPTFVAGTAEDLTKRVSVKARLSASMISALCASWLLGATVDELDIWGVDTLLEWAPFALAVTAVVVAGGVNAINIIDGFNGLAGSTVAVMLVTLAVVGFGVGDELVVELAVLGIGAVSGFLLVNYPKGRIFLGDGGAYFLGFWVAEIAVLLLVRNSKINAWQVLSICAYPVIEVLFSIYRRRILRQASPGAPDALHLHTLVYRRMVPRWFCGDQPWRRNAAVSFVIIPWIAAAAFMTVLFGKTVVGAAVIVITQLFFYILVYGRLVRGRWWSRPGTTATASENASIEV